LCIRKCQSIPIPVIAKLVIDGYDTGYITAFFTEQVYIHWIKKL